MRILYDSKHAARVVLGVAHARRNKSLASRCNDLVLRSKDEFYILIHHVCGRTGNAGMNAPTIVSVMFLPDGSDRVSCNVCIFFFGPLSPSHR